MSTGKSVICTLFENSYHYGLGALANSLYAHGYRGVLYAGYRGALPPWARVNRTDEWGNRLFQVGEGLSICFALLDTDEMLANVKPELIEQVWQQYGSEVENVFYIDCDIIIKAEWTHFEEWARHGVALCEDMNSPLPLHHPLRAQWREYYGKFGIDYRPRDNVYVNGGFVGLHRRYRDFAGLWQTLQEHMKKFTGKQDRIGIADRWNMFHFMDQDALNVAKDLTSEVSIMGPDAMDFGRFGYVMSHAAGPKKPWDKQYLKNIFATGARPTFTDKLYWQHVSHPIRLFPDGTIRRKQNSLKAAVLIGRFFTRT